MRNSAIALIAMALVACGGNAPAGSASSTGTTGTSGSGTSGGGSTGSTSANGPFNFSFHATGLQDYAGKTFKLTIHDSAISSAGLSNALAQLTQSPIPSSGELTLASNGPILEKGKSYNVAFYVDADSSGYCNPPPFDKSWLVSISSVNADVAYQFVADTNYQDVCGAFSP